jgi:hypothetical protein
MRPTLSCIATFGLLHCDTMIYIHFNEDAASKG